MSLDLSTCGAALRNAADSIFDCSNQWLIFAYKGAGYVLDVDCSGSSKEDMFDNFTASRIMYGFVRLDDPTSAGLAKYVFIMWQGEGAQEKYKIVCSQHVNAVKRLCKTVHLTVTARNDSDLDWDDIESKLRQSSFFGRPAPLVSSDAAEPSSVASVYKRIDPRAELKGASTSHQFWREKQAGTKLSLNKEPAKITDTNRDGIRQRALEESRHAGVTSSIRNKVQEFSEQIATDASSNGYKKIDPQTEIQMARKLSLSTLEDDDADTHVATNWQRVDPRAELAAVGGLSHTRWQPKQGNAVTAPPIPPLAISTTEPNQPIWPTADQPPVGTEPAGSNGAEGEPVAVKQPNPKYAAASLTAQCLYDYTAGESDELSFRRDDYVYYIQKVDEGWWIGSTEDGRMGLFPANYVELLT